MIKGLAESAKNFDEKSGNFNEELTNYQKKRRIIKYQKIKLFPSKINDYNVHFCLFFTSIFNNFSFKFKNNNSFFKISESYKYV